MPPRGHIHDQAVEMPRMQLMIVFITLTLIFFISSLDTTCVSTALPSIAADLNAGNSITWVGTSLLVASTTAQVIVSRLSDIFGRKVCLQVTLAIFAIGNLLCGFARNPAWLYAARGVAGIGAGGISSLGLIVISDVVSLRERGKYTSLMGIPITLAVGLGPSMGGALAQHASWRWAFWITVPPAVIAMPIIQYYLPLKVVPGSVNDKLKQVDWWGCIISLAAIVLLLVPISAGGSSWAWSSTESISMLVIGSVLLVAFLAVEYYHPLPIMPLHLFRNRTVALVFAAMGFVGIVWNGNFYIAPLYFQNVLGYTAVQAGALMVSMLVPQVILTTAAGFAMKKWGKARLLILIGYAIGTAGQGMQIGWTEHKNLALIISALALQGIGFGLTSQTMLVLAQASCDPGDRAVVTGLRHVFRNFGGAAGLAVSNAIMNAEFLGRLPPSLPAAVADKLRKDGLNYDYLHHSAPISDAQRTGTVHGYFIGLFDSFIMYTPVMFACFMFCCGCADTKLDDRQSPKRSDQDDPADATRQSPPTRESPATELEDITSPDTDTDREDGKDQNDDTDEDKNKQDEQIVQRATSSAVLSRKSSRRRVPTQDGE